MTDPFQIEAEIIHKRGTEKEEIMIKMTRILRGMTSHGGMNDHGTDLVKEEEVEAVLKAMN